MVRFGSDFWLDFADVLAGLPTVGVNVVLQTLIQLLLNLKTKVS